VEARVWIDDFGTQWNATGSHRFFRSRYYRKNPYAPTSEDARVILLSLSDKALQQIGSLTSKQELLNKLVSLAPRLSYTITLVFKDTDS
jgi:hypothetical protein